MVVDWSFFGQIRCINLYSREDRWKRSSNFFNKIGIPIEYYRVHKHNTDDVRGCYESHLSVMRHAYIKGCDNVLIFEDDVVNSPYYSDDLMDSAIDFMKNSKSWEIFYLGHQPNVLKYKNYPISSNIMKVHSTLTHAYVISRKYMEKIIYKPYEGIPIDKVLMENNESYAIYPMMFYQNGSSSDIKTSKPIHGVRASEIYAYHINYPLSQMLPLIIIPFSPIPLYFLLQQQYKERGIYSQRRNDEITK